MVDNTQPRAPPWYPCYLQGRRIHTSHSNTRAYRTVAAEVLCVVPRVAHTKLEPLARDNSIVGDTQGNVDRGLLVRVDHLVDIEPLEVFDDTSRVRVPVRHPPVCFDTVDECAACVLQGNG